MENLLLLFHREHRDAVALAVAADAKKSGDGLPPVQLGVGQQLPGIRHHPGLLEIEHLHHQILLGGEEGVEKGTGDAHLLIDLLHRGVLDALLCHQFQAHGHKILADLFPLRLGIGHLRHAGTSLMIKTQTADLFLL